MNPEATYASCVAPQEKSNDEIDAEAAEVRIVVGEAGDKRAYPHIVQRVVRRGVTVRTLATERKLTQIHFFPTLTARGRPARTLHRPV